MRRLTMICCSMCIHILCAAPHQRPKMTRVTAPEQKYNGTQREMDLPTMAIGKTPAGETNVYVAATMDSSIAITTLVIMGVIILLMIQVASTLATLRLCKEDRCRSYYVLIILCIPFVIIVSGIVFLVRKSPTMPLT